MSSFRCQLKVSGKTRVAESHVTALNCTALNSTVLYWIIENCSAVHCIVLYFTVNLCTLYTVHIWTALHCTGLLKTVLQCIVLYYTSLYTSIHFYTVHILNALHRSVHACELGTTISSNPTNRQNLAKHEINLYSCRKSWFLRWDTNIIEIQTTQWWI